MTAVEGEMKEVRTLAAGASQDVADYQAALRGHKLALEALNTTQVEQFETLRRRAEGGHEGHPSAAGRAPRGRR
uniref:hypothetical protein n=1 Tax=Paractinoplanes polyasparticus TaxID=2856853 RepID=UPI001C85A6E7|nr:hypothetical protein [Actinoplanes polyasparticus]